MNYTARVTKVDTDSKTKAYASVVVDNTMVIIGIKIVDGAKGLFVSMPSYQNSKGEYKDYCFILDKNEREKLEQLLISEYRKLG